MILKDFDGHYMLHYLSEKVLKGMGNDGTKLLVEHASAFVIDQANFWQKKQNTKMSMRYSHLIQYFGGFGGFGESERQLDTV